MVKVTLSCE